MDMKQTDGIMSYFTTLLKKTKDHKPQQFDLERHLLETADKYCEGMSEEQKEKLFARISCKEGNKGIKGKKIYKLKDLSPKNFPTNKEIKKMEKDKERPLLSIDDKLHQDSVQKVKALIKDFIGNNSQVSKDLGKLLDENNTELTIRIKKWGRINASVAFKKKEKESEKNKMVIFVSDEMFKREPYHEVLPGLLAHEFGHSLEFQGRPKGHEKEYMDGCETTADIIGTQLAVNAGYDSRGFGKFMENDFKDTKIVYDCTPNGDFRGDTMNLAHNEMSKIKQERSTDANEQQTDDKITAQKLRELQGVVSTKVPYKAPQKTQSTQLNISDLRYAKKSVSKR